MSAPYEAVLATAEEYVDSWAAGDFERLRGLLSDNAAIILPNSGDSPKPSYVFTGVDEAIGYLRFAFASFEHITFHDKEWVVSRDAHYVYLHTIGDMTTRVNSRKYANVYVLRFEFEGDKIARVLEYTNPIIWNNLGLS